MSDIKGLAVAIRSSLKAGMTGMVRNRRRRRGKTPADCSIINQENTEGCNHSACVKRKRGHIDERLVGFFK